MYYYQIWRTDERTHQWAFQNFHIEAKGKIVETSYSKPVTIYYESEYSLPRELFEKNGLSFFALAKFPTFKK